MGLNWLELAGMGWNGLVFGNIWNGLEWDGMGCNGLELSGLTWIRMEKAGISWNRLDLIDFGTDCFAFFLRVDNLKKKKKTLLKGQHIN